MNHQIFTITRRGFFKRTAVAAAATGIPAWFLEQRLDAADSPTPALANDKPSIALIGCGGRGRSVGGEAARFGNIVAVCDVDAKHAEAASKQFGGAKVYSDFRKLLERKDIVAVVNGTPDHWHTFVNIGAMKAGKDVYSEKPLTLTIDEGRKLVQVARSTRRILQTGSQQRSDARFLLACELVRNGRLGKLQHVDVYLPSGPNRGPFANAPVPDELDWMMWQGQAPEREYIPQRCHGSFRYWYEYSGGTMTDWGAHHNDIALWGIGADGSGPVSVEGKRLVDPIPGGFTAASEYKVEFTYANGVTQTTMSTRSESQAGGKTKDNFRNGVKFVGSEGWLYVTRGNIEASRPELITEPLTKKKVELYKSRNHMGNFFDCLRSRQQPICQAEIGHRSVSVCHLGVIAVRLGRKLNWDPAKELFPGDNEANSYVAREQRKPFTYDYV